MITNYLKAGYGLIQVITHEESRAMATISHDVKEAQRKLWTWSVTEGLTNPEGEPIDATALPLNALADFINRLTEGSALVMRDLHAHFRQPDPELTRKLRDCVSIGKQSKKTLIILGCEVINVPELSKDNVIVDFAMPGRAEIERVLDLIIEAIGKPLELNRVAVVDAAQGLTSDEAEQAFALSYAETGTIDATVVYREKCLTVKKAGLLEIVPNKVTFDAVGGLELLKANLHAKRKLMTRQAREYGIRCPRGVLIVGQPGSGKSLISQSLGTLFGVPEIRLKADTLFGSLVGQTEANWRSAWSTAKAIAPCVLWIDEIDGLFSGASGTSTDSGTTQRVLKAILQDLQDADGVFIAATANDIDRLPDPLVDRLDVWSVDLPNEAARADVWRIEIAGSKRNPDDFDLERISKATDGFSGRQIVQVWEYAKTIAFNADREPTDLDIMEALNGVKPTSETMKEAIEARRKRLSGKAQPASKIEERKETVRKF